MFETRTIARPWLIPAALAGVVAAVLWSHGPWGDTTALKHQTDRYHAMRTLQHQAAAETHRWKALYDTRGRQLAAARNEARMAVQRAEIRARQSSNRSFAAGVVAGRALERNAHAKSDNPGAVPAADGVYCDFRALWRGDGADCGDAEGLPAGGDGAGP